MKEEYNTLKDDFNIPIPNTGQTLTNEEKQKIKDYLEYMNIPLTYNTYTCAVYRYLNDDIKLLKKCISVD